jgi:hypothetical protein
MLQPGGGPDLQEESLRSQRGGELGAQDLEGDRPIVPEVVGEVDRGHPAASELTLDAVAIGQGGPEEIGWVGQRGNRRVPFVDEDGLANAGGGLRARGRARWGSASIESGHRDRDPHRGRVRSRKEGRRQEGR